MCVNVCVSVCIRVCVCVCVHVNVDVCTPHLDPLEIITFFIVTVGTKCILNIFKDILHIIVFCFTQIDHNLPQSCHQPL